MANPALSAGCCLKAFACNDSCTLHRSILFAVHKLQWHHYIMNLTHMGPLLFTMFTNIVNKHFEKKHEGLGVLGNLAGSCHSLMPIRWLTTDAVLYSPTGKRGQHARAAGGAEEGRGPTPRKHT
eukprot:scaffold87469_cov13-Tisochrysis_lutea.AAC.1